MDPAVQHLHTYFQFPFAIDRQLVVRNHAAVFRKSLSWFDCLDEWLASPDRAHGSIGANGSIASRLGVWRRNCYSRFDLDSEAYQDMVFFHPYARRVFFDVREADREAGASESLLKVFTLEPPRANRLFFEAQDATGRSARVEVTDLRLYLFANGMGILSIGVEASGLSAQQALWINSEMRHVYPSSSRQVREGRAPSRLAFSLESAGQTETLVEEDFSHGEMVDYLPPLGRHIGSLLYFANYAAGEFEPMLDERMIVYTYVALDPAGLPARYVQSEEYQVFLSRLLYVDRAGDSYRYDPEFTRLQMERHCYRRWAHQGTWYGFTSYSNVACTIGETDRDDHRLEEGFLIHRMFRTRYYLMATVALFYRATLLDFAERTALVSRFLVHDLEDGKLKTESIRLASDLRAEFLHFANYWHFDELANKDEEMEHFQLNCAHYRITVMKAEIEDEIEKLNASLHNHFQYRNTESINRLAMLSMILGAGAVATGFFGMNFGGDFARIFFDPPLQSQTPHWLAILAVAVLSLGAVALGIFLVLSNWTDYRETLLPRWWLARGQVRRNLKR
jgi:hypothetical protein